MLFLWLSTFARAFLEAPLFAYGVGISRGRRGERVRRGPCVHTFCGPFALHFLPASDPALSSAAVTPLPPHLPLASSPAEHLTPPPCSLPPSTIPPMTSLAPRYDSPIHLPSSHGSSTPFSILIALHRPRCEEPQLLSIALPRTTGLRSTFATLRTLAARHSIVDGHSKVGESDIIECRVDGMSTGFKCVWVRVRREEELMSCAGVR